MVEPSTIVFDVNETLSDMSPLSQRFTDIGLPEHLAALWFTTVLRDGFALTAAGDEASFPLVAAEAMRVLLTEHGGSDDVDNAVQRLMTAMAQLRLHPDVVEGVRALKAAGLRLVTLTNGGTDLAGRLFTEAGIREDFDALLSVDGASRWKPARGAYEYAAAACAASPEEMVLVAVHPWDIHGAAKAGMRTAWLNRADARYPAYFTSPDLTIQDLTALPAALTALA